MEAWGTFIALAFLGRVREARPDRQGNPREIRGPCERLYRKIVRRVGRRFGSPVVSTQQSTAPPVEPSDSQPAAGGGGRWLALSRRIERYLLGRLTLHGLRWAVVFALIGSGYFGAEAIRDGVHLASAGGDAQHLLASSPSHR